MSEVKRTERGWAGHFIGAAHCSFRRNTLIEYEGVGVVVSTVGNYIPDEAYGVPEAIGYNRYYETMAFLSDNTIYKDSDISKRVDLLNLKWSINKKEADIEADRMHEDAVDWVIARLKEHKLPYDTKCGKRYYV